ncbi:hypothetical protein [Nocardiopsis trehalosi]|uniref:hypothetical protein n=1 Tax=Nocardiopsis trehalosi TaxID=109329 RepID=UPI00082D503C|nr:hypothetical protein [Nocardiopsis trehalosi]
MTTRSPDWEAFVDAYPQPSVEQVFPDAHSIATALRLSTAEAALVTDAYQVGATFVGPFQTPHSTAMLEALKAEVAAQPHRRIAFVGRDGHLIAAGVRARDPDFFAAHCTEIVLSRPLIEAVVQDREAATGTPSPLGPSFRARRAWVEEFREDIPGTAARLTSYLHRSGLPVGEPGSALTIVDNGLRGTAQEVLALEYPQTDIRGHYTFLTLAPDDTNPDRKRGYAYHLGPEYWTGGPTAFLPRDPALTLLCDSALILMERLISGPTYSALRITGPVPDRSTPENLNPFPAKYDLGGSLAAERVRQGMRAAVILGAAHHARHAASRPHPPGRDPLTVQIRYWLTGNPRGDAVFDRVAGILSSPLEYRPEPVDPPVPLPRGDVTAVRRGAIRAAGPSLEEALATRGRSAASPAALLHARHRHLGRNRPRRGSAH